MMLILMMVMFSLGQVVLDSPPAENPPTENGTRSPVDNGYFLENGLQDCPSTCETCESNTTCTLCKTTYYGPACQLKCDCNGKRCNKVAGVCPQGCPYGKYGKKCELQCPGCGSCEICHRNTGQCLQCHNNCSLQDGVCHDWFAANTNRTPNLDISTNLTAKNTSSVTNDCRETILLTILITVLFVFLAEIGIAILIYCRLLKRRIPIKDNLSRQVSEEFLSIQVSEEEEVFKIPQSPPMPFQCVDSYYKPVQEQTNEIQEGSYSKFQVAKRDDPSDDDTNEKPIFSSSVKKLDG